MQESKVESLNTATIFLVGFMGAGKTTVGKALAQILHRRFLDLDEVIEEKAGQTVREIFAEFGEAHFRQLERQAIQSCSAWRDTVIALGGGAYVAAENRAALRDIGQTVWLDCPLDLCFARVANDRARPLATTQEEMQALLAKRLPAYAQADLHIPVAGKNAEQIALEIIAML
ncbi:MAG: shikimate kinase [Acidobacteria bacterium]|nr:shikimate kinase [Acidobacteriota bacterium]